MSFFEELKRRNVVRVGIAYVLIGWALAQAAELALGTFGAPEWVMKSFLFLLILGLPLALFFAWAFEMTPEGIKREKDVDRSKSITPQTGQKLDRIIIGVLVVAVGILLTDKFLLQDEPVTTEEVVATGSQSIAVLPFVNMSGDDDYFADGLSEELLNLLAKSPDLKVAGRTSSFAFKGRNEDLREIGSALGVEHVLEGSVRRSGDRLRITAQLIKVDDGFHVWSETYDRQMADIFDIQDDVSGAITDALKLHLSPRSERPTDNAEAYALYMQALALQTYADGASDIELAQSLLDRAIEMDTEFAEAYELKSNFYWLASGWILDAPTGQKLAYASATKALELDPTLAGAKSYAATAHPDWSWIMEFEALEELVRVEPTNISALEALAYDSVIAGYFNESVRLARRIIELEPLSSLGYWRAGEALFAAGRDREARSSLTRAAELGDWSAIWLIACESLLKGDLDQAFSWYERSQDMLEVNPGWVQPFINAALDPDTGKASLDDWVNARLASATNIDERRMPFLWYLLFGYLDDYWGGIDTLAGEEVRGWDNADTLEHMGMVLRRTGFARHPQYLERVRASSLMNLWDKRGPPDHCNKVAGQWVCE